MGKSRMKPKNASRAAARTAFKQAKAQGASTNKAAARAGRVAHKTRTGKKK